MRELNVGDRLDQYLITDVLARTEMAVVFEGQDIDDGGRRVCIKVPHLHFESDVVFQQRLEREERILRRIEHPRVVRALAPCGKSRMYLVTEYIEGRTLRALIDQRALPVAYALRIAGQLCATLADLHRRRIVHRDVKPENVIVDGSGRIKLIDFGIALDRSARRLTWGRLSHVAGTPDYAAPERIKGGRGDERTDVYAAGLVIYEMLTGRLPQAGADARTIMRARILEDPLPPTYFVPGLDPALSAVVTRAVSRLPAQRYQTATAFLEALEDPDAELRAAAGAGLVRPRRPAAVSAMIAAVITTVLAALLSLTWISR